MTKLRPPVSPELALTRIAGAITWERCAEIVGQADRTVRNWSDPDTPAEISFKDAVKLDAAYLCAGGGTAPFRDTYQLMLEGAAAEACADSNRLAERTAAAAREAGDAVSALVMASRPGASAGDKLIAARETEEAVAALSATLPHLTLDKRSGPGVPLPAPGIDSS